LPRREIHSRISCGAEICRRRNAEPCRAIRRKRLQLYTAAVRGLERSTGTGVLRGHSRVFAIRRWITDQPIGLAACSSSRRVVRRPSDRWEGSRLRKEGFPFAGSPYQIAYCLGVEPFVERLLSGLLLFDEPGRFLGEPSLVLIELLAPAEPDVLRHRSTRVGFC
jgi:hypothetical protein